MFSLRNLWIGIESHFVLQICYGGINFCEIFIKNIVDQIPCGLLNW